MAHYTCFTGSDNTQFEFPARMSDGHLNTNWNSASRINQSIRNSNGIRSNNEYRRYLINNADSIIGNNKLEACKGTAYHHAYEHKPYERTASDLKQIYLTRHELNGRMIAPVMTQAEFVTKGVPRKN